MDSTTKKLVKRFTDYGKEMMRLQERIKVLFKQRDKILNQIKKRRKIWEK